MARTAKAAAPAKRTPIWAQLYAQVLVAIVAGAAVGYFQPKLGVDLKPLGDAFIKLVKMIIAPVIFLTVVTGIGAVAITTAAEGALGSLEP